jgi:hypothetical protein
MTGTATLAIAVVPPDVTCVQITAVGSRTVQQTFPVTPSASSVLTMNGLPTGSVAFSGDAYSLDTTSTASCAGLGSSNVPTWLSNTVTANVLSTSSVALTLEMTQNGQSTITVDFPDSGSPPPFDSGVDSGSPPVDAGSPADAGKDAAPPVDAGSPPADAGSDASSPDAGPADAGSDAAAAPVVTIATPNGTSYVSSQALSVQVSAVNGVPSTVDLLVDGAIVTTLASPFQYSLATASLAVGTHTLVANGHFGGTTIASAARSIVVDRTAPTIAVRTPASGATNVHVADPITVQFSEAILASSVTGSSVTLTYNGASIGYATSLSPDGTTLTVSPASPTDGGGTLSIAVTSAITDLAGNALSGGPLSWSWTPPQWLSYAAPALPTYTSTTAYSASNMLLLNASWAMGSSTLFELNTSPTTTSGATLPSNLYTTVGSTWSSVAIPTAPTPPTGWTNSSMGFYFDPSNANVLTAYAYLTTSAPPAGTYTRFLEDLATYSGSAWSAFALPSWEDPNYGAVVTDPAGNGYHMYCPLNGTECDLYKRTSGTWSLLTKLTVPSTNHNLTYYTGNGTYLVFSYPWSTTTTVSGNLVLSQWNGTAWVTLANAANPVNATSRTWYQLLVDSSNNPYVGYASCATTNSNDPCSVNLMVPSAGAWQLFGGAALPTQVYNYDAMSVSYAFYFDRYNRLSALLDGYSGTSGVIQPLVIDYRSGAWGAPIDVPAPTTGAATDIGFGVSYSGGDWVGNPAWLETHATADSTGLKATATATAHLINR